MAPPAEYRIDRVALPGREGVHHLTLRDGSVASIAVSGQTGEASWLALPGLVNLHAHADRAYAATSFRPRSFSDALAAAARARADFTVSDVRRRARHFFERSISHGVTRIRTHTDVDPVVADGRQRQPAGIAANRRRGGPREVDRPRHCHYRHGGRDPEGRALALRQRDRGPRRDQSEDRRDAVVAAAAGGRHGRKRRHADRAGRRQEAQSRRPGRRLHRRAAAAARIRPHRRAVGQAGDRAEGARGRARPAVSGIQGPHRRHRQRHRQAGRIRQRGGRSRPRRSDRAPRRDAAARSLPQRRPHPRVHLRRAPRAARPADFSVADPPPIHVQAVRPGGAGNL